MLTSVFLRIISILLQAYFYSERNEDGSYFYYINDPSTHCTRSFIFICITLPEWSFFIAYIVLVIFFVQLTCVLTLGLSLDVFSYRVMTTLLSFSTSQRKFFVVEVIFLSLFVLLMRILYVFFGLIYPEIIFSILCAFYFTLFVSLTTGTWGPIILVRVLRRHNTPLLNGISVRLFSSCLLYSLLFLFKALSYASTTSAALIQSGNFIHRIGLTSLLELIPMVSVFAMMHRKPNPIDIKPIVELSI